MGRRTAFGPSTVQRALEGLGTPEDVLRRHGITVRRRKALCPLHQDVSPSLNLFKGRDGKWRWYCHGCEQGGDSLDLESALTGKSIRELLG